jgi:hypothetical protein
VVYNRHHLIRGLPRHREAVNTLAATADLVLLIEIKATSLPLW